MIKNKKIDVVIVYDLSRLSRSVKETFIFIEDYIKKYEVDFVCLDMDIDTSKPIGKFLLTMVSGFNELYRNEIAYKTKKALKHKKDKNERVGTIPYGYDLGNDGKKLIKNDKEQKNIKYIINLREQGLSYNKICKKLNNMGIKTKKGNSIWLPITISNIYKANKKKEVFV
jgi:DNA invertase Pin-like site-specific DNA recombinase